ncbi:hypothetical protein BV22DRAFT_1185833 [Leucogyrophana mollusca]|uniref:Uncharacterized protein n=1 Tax=Leucogyrophana mollusca TaxID=85980 RepID=A0ACB8AZX9_9AGAM|nr:hypothetical protein BV22DRAFT_1185833 [Leucogyrophana mollusca]
MPDPWSELISWIGRVVQLPKRDQNIPSPPIGSPSRNASYSQPVYSSSPQLLHQHNTEKLSPARELIDNKRADLVQNLVLPEHGLSTGMLSTTHPHKLSDVPPVSATVVTPGADNSSKPNSNWKHRMSLSSLIEKAVGHRPGELVQMPAALGVTLISTIRKLMFSGHKMMKILPSEHARNISSPVIGAHHVEKLSNIIPLDMPHPQSLLLISARDAPLSATADTSFLSNNISAAPSDDVRPVGASLTPLPPPERSVTPLFLPDSPTSSSPPIYKGRWGDEDEESFVNDMLTENPKPDPSGSQIASPAVLSPALTPGDSLFIPPPELPRSRPREILDYVTVPPFPKGLTRANYKLSPLGRLARSQRRPGVTMHNSVGDVLTAACTSNALSDSGASSERKGKGRERTAEEHEPPPWKKYKPHVPELFGADITAHSNGFIDPHLTPTVPHLPDLDLDLEPAPSSPQVLQSNTLHVPRRVSEKHSETEFISPFSPFFEPSTQRKPDTAHAASSQWVYAPPSNARQEDKGMTARTQQPPVSPVKTGVSLGKVVRPTSVAHPEAQTPAASTSAEPNDHSRVSSTPFLDPHHIDDNLSMDVDMNMDEYFNGLGHAPSPSKRMAEDVYMPLAISRDTLGVQHRQRHHDQHAALWRFSSNPDMGGQGEGSGGFLGVPHNPDKTEIQLATRTSPDYKSEFATEPGHHDPFMGTPGGSAGGVLDLDPWNLVVQDHVSPANVPVGPLGGGTIDPSLLGGGELEKPNSHPSHLMSPTYSALSPGPVVCIRPPEGHQDGSAQLLRSSSKLPRKGKRAVQFRYRPTASVQASDDAVVYVPKRNQSTPDSDASRAGQKTKPKRPRQPHVFVGVPQPSWGVKSFRYLDEAADDVPDAMLQGSVKGGAAGGRRARVYIGDRSALYEPFKRMSDLDLSAATT